LWGIWLPLRAKTKSQGADLSSFYDKITTYFTVLWICYPIVWILGPSGFRVINQTVETFLFCLIPFFSKVGFSYLDLNGLRNLHRDTAEMAGDRLAGSAFELAVASIIPRTWQRRRRAR
jgi:bacteriorhodopsin